MYEGFIISKEKKKTFLFVVNIELIVYEIYNEIDESIIVKIDHKNIVLVLMEKFNNYCNFANFCNLTIAIITKKQKENFIAKRFC